MKREDLIEYKADENFGNGLVYSIPEVNQVLDEKDAEIDDLLRQNRELCQALQVMYSKEEYGKLQKEIESLKASHYADSVDAGMRERRLKRALYKVCAMWAKCEERINNRDAYDALEYLPSAEDKFRKNAERWGEMATKCLKKAEEYK